MEEPRVRSNVGERLGGLAPLPQELVHVPDRIAQEFGHPVPGEFRGVVADRFEDPPVLMQTVILDARPPPAS